MPDPIDNRPAAERLLYRIPADVIDKAVLSMIKGRRIWRIGGEFVQKQAKPGKITKTPSAPIGRPRVARSGVFLFEGIEVFHGSPCRKWGHTLRYSKNGNCVECNRLGDSDDGRGETYEGTPCRKGGHTTRYVRGGACVECMRNKGG